MGKANITIQSNVTGTQSASPALTEEDKRKVHGAVLAKMEPNQFDKRVMEAGHSIATSKQKEQYLEDLPCSLCGQKGGKCGCGERS